MKFRKKPVEIEEVKRKTNKQLAEYLSFINPHNAEIYNAIAEFLGEDNLIIKPL